MAAAQNPSCWRSVPAFLGIVGVGLTTLALAGCVLLLVLEWSWERPSHLGEAAAFERGSIGTEQAPLPVFEVLPDLFSDGVDYFQPRGPGYGDWIDQFGFIRQADSRLPLGFYVSNLRPVSGAGSPVPFVGLSCALCHSAEVRVTPDGPAKVFIGAGTPHADVLAFTDAVRGAISAKDKDGEYRLSAASVSRALHAKRGHGLGPAEWAIVTAWLGAARAEESKSETRFDDPAAADQLFNPKFIRAGPSRTQPFRSLVRVVLERPGASGDEAAQDAGFSKIPAVYHQHKDYHGEWAQFDGSVKNHVARSTLAAMTAGGTADSQARPEIAHNTIAAADYTLHLAPPKWTDVPDLAGYPPPDKKAEVEALRVEGAEAYRTECRLCHGDSAPNGGWAQGSPGWFGTLKDVGTDAERRRFRHREQIPAAVYHLYADYPRRHPLKFDESDLRDPTEPGYYCGPIGGAFLRAPYLHNGSVLTLAELIGLKDRRPVFFRGRNLFDPEDVGLKSPAGPDARHYFEFRTDVRGNSNAGHYYPEWAWGPADETGVAVPRKLGDADARRLRALLEYLKTI
jgi:mono/diheme cytochrome c family protein